MTARGRRDADHQLALLQFLARTARGPRREGAFAVWLVVRVAEDLTLTDRPTDRAHRRRVQALEKRLSSLTLPPPLRRALVGTLAELREGTAENGVVALEQLVAPVRESVGPEAAEAVRQAAHAAKWRLIRLAD